MPTADDIPHELLETQSKEPARPKFPYFSELPYQVEDDSVRIQHLNDLVKELYICVKAGDFNPGARNITRQLKRWMGLKFQMPKDIRGNLMKIYYELSLSPGMDASAADSFMTMFRLLANRRKLPVEEYTLDWRPLYKDLYRNFIQPNPDPPVGDTIRKGKDLNHLNRLALAANEYFLPSEIPNILEACLPEFETYFLVGAFNAMGLLNLLLPRRLAISNSPSNQSLLYHLPLVFSLWSQISNSSQWDFLFLDTLSSLAKRVIQCPNVLPLVTPYGVFTKAQTLRMVTTAFRLLNIPIATAGGAAYSKDLTTPDNCTIVRYRGPRTGDEFCVCMARWIVWSMTPRCLEDQDGGILGLLEGMIQAIETSFHPSNSANYTTKLVSLIYRLSDAFTLRWNMELNGKLEEIPHSLRLTPALKRRFVLSLRKVTFMSIYDRGGTGGTAQSTLSNLAFLEPDLVLPGCLKRIYPSMAGLLEAHRTTSSLASLCVLAPQMCRTKYYRNHITTLLGLSLPGIDSNDLKKTTLALTFIATAASMVPFADISGGRGTAVAEEWITEQMEILENMTGDDYSSLEELKRRNGLSVNGTHVRETYDDDDLVTSSSGGFAEFVTAFMDKIFLFLSNMPDPSRTSGAKTQEEVLIPMITLCMQSVVASLGPELFTLALKKTVEFVERNVYFPAAEVAGNIVQVFVQTRRMEALSALVPVLCRIVISEIESGGGQSGRIASTEVLPRDRYLLWNLKLLGAVLGGRAGAEYERSGNNGYGLLEFRKDIQKVIIVTMEHCRGPICHYIGRLVTGTLGSLTNIYPFGEPYWDKAVCDISDWGGWIKDYPNFNVMWHIPSQDEIAWALELYETLVQAKITAIQQLLSDGKMNTNNKSSIDWIDDLRRHLAYLTNVILSGGFLYERIPPPANEVATTTEQQQEIDEDAMDLDATGEIAGDADPDEDDEDDVSDDEVITGKTQAYEDGFRGNPLQEDQQDKLRKLGDQIVELLHEVCVYLRTNRADEMQAFVTLVTTMYSWLYTRGMAKHLDIRGEVASRTAYSIRKSAFQFKGIRKTYYPRAILVHKEEIYHLDRQSHNAAIRPAANEQQQLLIKDIIACCVSSYIDIRKPSQGILYSLSRRFKKWASLMIPPILDAMTTNDMDQVKGALHSLRMQTFEHHLARDWRFHDQYVLKLFDTWHQFDRESVQNLCSSSVNNLYKYLRATSWKVLYDPKVVDSIVPSGVVELSTIDEIHERIQKKRGVAERKRRDMITKLADITRNSRWRIATNAGAYILTVLFERDQLLPNDVIALFFEKMNDKHPLMRATMQGKLAAYFRFLGNLGFARSDDQLLLKETKFPNDIIVFGEDEAFVQNYLETLNKPPEANSVFHDVCGTGMFVWPGQFTSYQYPRRHANLDLNPPVRDQIEALAPLFTRNWVKQQFDYLCEENSNGNSGLRNPDIMCWPFFFRYFRELRGAITDDEMREEIIGLIGDGTDKHRHQTLCEILFSLIMSLKFAPKDYADMTWEWVLRLIEEVIQKHLKPDNIGYWKNLITSLFAWRDPRQSWPLLEYVTRFRLDNSSNEFFQESARACLLRISVQQVGWRFTRAASIFRDYLDCVIHPYQEVRKEVGIILGCLSCLNQNLSFPNVQAVIDAGVANNSSTGFSSSQPSPEFGMNVKNACLNLQKWRAERVPGQTSEGSSYTSGGQTILNWWTSAILGSQGHIIYPFIADLILPEVLYMMDIKEELDFAKSAASLLKYLSNAPYPAEYIPGLVTAIERIGKHGTQWHHRLRIMITIQIFYYRQLFVLNKDERDTLFEVVIGLLNDSQLEVREAAAVTLSGMIQCSKFAENRFVDKLRIRFEEGILLNPMPKRRTLGSLGSGSGISTPQANGINTPVEPMESGDPLPSSPRLWNPDAEQLIRRHAAVLGLGALITAFPYEMKIWMPKVLAILADKASGDRGMIGSSVKKTLGDFKKTHQDTWQMDKMMFQEEELESLEGVFSANYFA